MPKINVINDKTGEVKEIECIGFDLQYVTDEQTVSHIYSCLKQIDDDKLV